MIIRPFSFKKQSLWNFKMGGSPNKTNIHFFFTSSLLHVCGVATIILLCQDFSSDGGKNKEFFFLICKKKNRVST
jgi:hypothetical protein